MSWEISKGVELLKQGKLIAFKTDTIPGIACDPLNPEAVAKIYQLKEREQKKPLVVMISDIDSCDYWAMALTDAKRRLLTDNWPGNLTVIFRMNQKLNNLFDSETIGLRIPAKDVLRELIRKFGSGIAVTSANLSGEEELLTISDIKGKFGNKIDFYLDDEETQTNIASTVIDLQEDQPKVLRGNFQW